jgi:hypothetical protein
MYLPSRQIWNLLDEYVESQVLDKGTSEDVEFA